MDGMIASDRAGGVGMAGSGGGIFSGLELLARVFDSDALEAPLNSERNISCNMCIDCEHTQQCASALCCDTRRQVFKQALDPIPALFGLGPTRVVLRLDFLLL